MTKQQKSKAFVAALAGLSIAIASATPANAEQRSFTILAFEAKGGAMADKEPFPANPMPAGEGYVLKKPDATGRWEVSTYMWLPSQITVNQGDDVTLDFVGINGASHPVSISGYNKTFVVARGTSTKISFKADKAGVFKIDCGLHMPTMTAELIVTPGK